jgi:hypothetical protein
VHRALGTASYPLDAVEDRSVATFGSTPIDDGRKNMAHAVVLQVQLPDGGRTEEGMRMLNDVVVPQVKSHVGFQRGMWMHNGGDGMAVIVFDTGEHAGAAQDSLKPPPGGPALVSSVVFEIDVDA